MIINKIQMTAKEIKDLNFTIVYNNGYQTWEGKTPDRTREIIAKGYATVYPAHCISSNQVEYESTLSIHVLAHNIFTLK